MSLNAALTLVLDELKAGREQSFKGNPVAEFIRRDAPEEVRAIVNDPRYIVEGSPGRGNWADVPWIAIMDIRITDSAQSGYYVVYLFKTDSAGVILSLNQGVTKVREFYKAKAHDALKARARDFLARLGNIDTGLIHGPISLEATAGQALARDYEVGSIVAKEYNTAQTLLPDDDLLSRDLQIFLNFYKQLADDQHSINEVATVEEDETGLENVRPLREHKRYERNPRLAREAKKIHGFICQACGFDFERSYGLIGRGFIEAHHLVPLSELGGERIGLDPRTDFAVLCSNCHSMIHRTYLVHDVEAFAREHLQNRQIGLGL